jgi:hypothetical protein
VSDSGLNAVRGLLVRQAKVFRLPVHFPHSPMTAGRHLSRQKLLDISQPGPEFPKSGQHAPASGIAGIKLWFR